MDSAMLISIDTIYGFILNSRSTFQSNKGGVLYEVQPMPAS